MEESDWNWICSWRSASTIESKSKHVHPRIHIDRAANATHLITGVHWVGGRASGDASIQPIQHLELCKNAQHAADGNLERLLDVSAAPMRRMRVCIWDTLALLSGDGKKSPPWFVPFNSGQKRAICEPLWHADHVPRAHLLPLNRQAPIYFAYPKLNHCRVQCLNKCTMWAPNTNLLTQIIF